MDTARLRARTKFAPLLVMACVSAAGGVFAQGTEAETSPLENDDFFDFRIEECSHVPGIGYLEYGKQGDAAGPFGTTDICVDPDKGEIISRETRAGLTRVKGPGTVLPDSPPSGYELLSGDEVVTMNLSPLPAPFLCATSQTGAFFVDANFEKGSPQGRDDSAYGFLRGFTQGIPFGGSALPEKSNYVFSLAAKSDGSGNLIDYTETLGDLHFAFYAAAENTDDELAMTITKGDGISGKDAKGNLSYKFYRDDRFSLSGRFQIDNAKIAGAREWVSVTGRIEHMRGFVSGETGQHVFALGIALGRYTKPDGTERSARFLVGLNSCNEATSTNPFIFP